MENDSLLVEKDGNICTLVLNRPEKRNSLTRELLLKISGTIEELSDDESIRVLIIRGKGDQAFCSGFDITTLPSRDNSEVLHKSMVHQPLTHALDAVVNFPFPVIAMLNGSAFGAGCELAICADIRIGAEGITMGMPPAKIGLVYSPSGIKRFVQMLGLPRTKEIFFTGDAYFGNRLKEIGLVDYSVAPDELEEFTRNMALRIAKNAPISLKGIKRIINLVTGKVNMEADDEAEAEAILANAYCSEDFKEGQRAFIERRKPRFRGE